jgi:hypothetical protein
VRPFFDWFKNKPEGLSAARLEEQAKVFVFVFAFVFGSVFVFVPVVVFAFSALSCFVLPLPLPLPLHFFLVFSVLSCLSLPCILVLCFLSCLFCPLACLFCLVRVRSVLFLSCLSLVPFIIHGLVMGLEGQGRAQASRGSAECCSRYLQQMQHA